MKYRIPDTTLLQDVADEMVLLNPESGEYYTLDAVGARMITLLRDLDDEATVVEALVTEYEVDEARVTKDLRALLEQMAGQGLVEAVAD